VCLCASMRVCVFMCTLYKLATRGCLTCTAQFTHITALTDAQSPNRSAHSLGIEGCFPMIY